MSEHHMDLEDLLAARLSGASPEVPAELREEFDLAVAAHGMLEALFQETAIPSRDGADDRRPPVLPAEYQIERELGRGGMGVVYLALQKPLGRRVALKVLRPGERTFGPLVRRFLDEARHLARLRHPNIVSIHEIGDADGEPYFTMDYVEGESLATLLQRGPLPPSQAVEILKQIAAAVQHAHRQGIIHRDLKPSNVLVDAAGRVFVTDFGLARDLTQASQLTLSGELLGTPQYMAPEQARGEAGLIGEATDIHALGMILYEMLVGRPPYGSASPVETLMRLLNEEPVPLRRQDRRIPRDLETICLKMLGKSPAARYTSVGALLEDVRRYEAGESLLARRTSPIVKAWRWSRRHWKTAATIALTAAVVLAAAPRLFDKSYEDLVAWGDEELADGRPEVAAQVYARALRRADDLQRDELVARIAQTCRALDDPREAVELALKVVESSAGVSFGPHDYLVAQALVTQVKARSPAGTIDLWHATPPPELELIRTRLELALNGKLPDDQRAEAARTLEAVNLALSQDRSWARVTASHLARLPEGSVEELRALADDEARPLWNRGKAALALGRQLEAERDAAAALIAYRQAYECFRKVYPMYGGVKAAIGARTSRVDAPDAEECRLVQDAIAAVRRLSPESLAEPRGTIQFEVVGVPLPPTVGIDLVVQLCDPAIGDPHLGLGHNLPRLVPLQQGTPVRVRVLDGTYRLQTQGHASRWEPDADRFSRRLQLDVEDWPETIEVRGETVHLPPVRLRLADEIALRYPATGASADLRTLELRWDAVAGADHYRVQLSYTAEMPHPSHVYFDNPRTTEPRLRFADLPAADRKLIRENLCPGRTAGWRVDAYDSTGNRIGMSLEEHRFLVTQGLDD